MVLYFVWLSAGIITLSKWCEAMEAATHLGLPWRLLREKLAPIQSEAVPTDVHYMLTLQMLDTDLIVSTCNCKFMHRVFTKWSRLLFRTIRDGFRSLFREQFGFSTTHRHRWPCMSFVSVHISLIVTTTPIVTVRNVKLILYRWLNALSIGISRTGLKDAMLTAAVA